MAFSLPRRDGNRPLSIRDLSISCGVACSELCIRCNFCGKVLDFIEKVYFDYACLQLLWKHGYPRACCKVCARIISTWEFTRFYEDTLNPREVEDLLGIPFLQLNIRCYLCLRLLSTFEKAQVEEESGRVHRVRGAWRTKCYWCRGRTIERS
uniref:Protein E6 n=1 Tax=Firstpapillomavirinae sp. TaxID=2809408 RepID=A0AA51GEI9_9PAPI|nr:E6 protein [Firstpapillomavirinae sp.]